MNMIEKRALELYPEKNIQWSNYLEDMNGSVRMFYIRGAEEQRMLDIRKSCKWLCKYCPTQFDKKNEMVRCVSYENGSCPILGSLIDVMNE